MLKNNILRARGFLLRKSIKYKAKWTYCFYYIDINQFVSSGKKVLFSYRPMKKLIDVEFMKLINMKRYKLSETSNLLLIPLTNHDPMSKQAKYICMRYVEEERVLNDVLDVFKDA